MPNIIRPRQPHEPKHLVNGEPQIIFEARIGAIVNFPMLEDQGEGYVEKTFEKYVRPPGLRIITLKEGKIYLQKEFRWEGEGFQWRLPGGKLLNSFAEYKPYLSQSIPENIIFSAAAKELLEEAHFKAKTWSLSKRDICGTTVEWDLYYVIAEDLETLGESGSVLDGAAGEGEDIRNTGWFTFSEVKKMCETGEIDEGRTVAVLIQFMSSRG